MVRVCAKVLAVIISVSLAGCDGGMSVDLLTRGGKATVVQRLDTIVAKPGETVQISGQGFKVSKKYTVKFTTSDGSQKIVPMTVINDINARFVMPDGMGLGVKEFAVFQGGRMLSTLSIVLDQDTNNLPISLISEDETCSTITFINAKGEAVQGKRNCSATTATSQCSSDGQIGCVTTDAFKAVNTSNVIPGNIKAGIVIAGVTGDYPSASSPLPGASVTADLDAATFSAKVKSSSSFEYWTSDGVRQTATGDTDIAAGNIKDSVSIFGESGTYTGAPPNAWDIRAGKTVNGVLGKLKIDCRNSATLATFDMGLPMAANVDSGSDTLTVAAHGYTSNQTIRINYSTTPGGLDNSNTYYVRNPTTNTFQLATTSGGTPIDITTNGASVFVMRFADGTTDIWDSIDDYNGVPASTPTNSGWSSDNFCGGVEVTVDDSNVWKDVTTTGDGVTASTCAATAAHCSLKDKITGNEWHKADAVGRNWTEAVAFCDGLTYNGKSDWRLPTQKELYQAYVHGITSTAGVSNWMALGAFRDYFAAATSQSLNSNYTWYLYLAFGVSNTNLIAKTDNTFKVMCVRP